MYQFILLINVFTAVCIITLVLVQQGKGATMGAGFGSGASQTLFGSRGTGSFLFRVTMSFALVFFLTSIGLNYMATKAYKQTRVVTLPATPAVPVPTSSNAPVTPASEQAPTNNKTSEIPVR